MAPTNTRTRISRARPRLVAVAVIAVMLALSSTAVHADDDAPHRLYHKLLETTPGTMLRGYSTVRLKQIAPNAQDSQAGVIGIASLVFAGQTASTVDIRYAVFANADAAGQFAGTFGQRLSGQQLFFPFLPDASCAARGQMQICGTGSGNVFILAIARALETANTHERQVTNGVSAGNALQYGLDNLRQVRNELGQNPQAAQAPPPAPSLSEMAACKILTSSEAAAAMRSPVMSPRGDSSTCFYGSRSSAGDGVGLQLIDGGRSKFDFDRGRMSNITTVNGVGDAAFEFVSLAGFVQLYVLKGNQYFAITLTNRNDRSLRRSANQLAKEIADQLPGH